MDDLWAAQHEDIHTLDTFSEHGRSTRTGRLSERIVVSHLRDWLLEDYAATYCRALAATRIFRRCYWIDALGSDTRVKRVGQDEAQPTTKRNKGEVVPQLQSLVTLAGTLAQEDKPLALRGLVLTGGSSKRHETRSHDNGSTSERTYTLPKESGLLPASWLEIAPTLLAAIEQSPAIFLLNPLGATTFLYDDLTPLYQRAVPTELCLLIVHKQVGALLRAAHHSKERAATLTGLVRSDRWKVLPQEEEQLEQAVSGWLELFTGSMQRHFPFAVQRIAVQAQTAPATITALPYTLLFATRRQDSLMSMNDAVYYRQRRLQEQSWRGLLSEAWFFEQDRVRRQEQLQQLTQHMLQQGRAQRARRWPDLRQQLILQRFGRLPRQDYDACMRQLLLDGEVRCAWQQPLHDQPDERIPGNNDTLQWR